MRLLKIRVSNAELDGRWFSGDGQMTVELPELPVDQELAAARQELVVERQRAELELARLRLRIERLERVPWWRRIWGRERSAR